SRRSHRYIVGAVTLAYLVFYLFVIGDLSFGLTDFSFTLGSLGLVFKQISTLYFEPIARVNAGILTYLFSPLNF
ncbi:MAG: hypothetical protein SXQ77_01785, partial [Halobacteria archaeon]|nr:hypothetical protein [Halobacteria archaeon]